MAFARGPGPQVEQGGVEDGIPGTALLREGGGVDGWGGLKLPSLLGGKLAFGSVCWDPFPLV